MKNHRNVIFKWLLPIVLVVIGLITINTCSRYKNILYERDLIFKALNDTIQYFKDKDGLNKARISVLETSNLDYFTSLEVRDQEIKNLQNLVKKQGKNLSSATTIKTVTKIDTIVKIKYKEDKNNTDFEVEEFPFNFNGWVFGEVSYHKDSIGMIVNIKNNLSILHKKDDKGHYVEVFDKNPYTTTESIRSYYKITPNKTIKPKKWSVGPNISYGINYKGEFTPYIGIGLQYNLIRF